MMPHTRTDVFYRQSAEVASIFGDLEIVEAKADFVVYVTADEQQQGISGDPNNCMFALGCKRAFGSKGVLFYPTIAYVDMLDPSDPSRRIVMRFMLPAETRRRLEAFDRGEGGFKEATFILKAVPKYKTLAQQAKQKLKQKRALLRGSHSAEYIESRKAAAAKALHTRRNSRLMGVRSGTGQVHTRTLDA
jgi:hypothetical protein